VTSYLKVDRMPMRLQRMVFETRALEVLVTHTEAEALLLESNLIKELKPRYNVLLRDDKSFPDIAILGGHPFPRIVKHRGARQKEHEYFGPFASASAVNGSLATLQKVFLLRTCTDAVFESRTRPCLLHQIKRCSAPCVGKVSEAAYGALVGEARDFLSGHSAGIQRRLAAQMEQASTDLAFETAAALRDRIRSLTAVQTHQGINLRGIGEADVIALHRAGGHSCVQVFFLRGGQNFGNRAYYPVHAAEDADSEILEAFIGQFYAAHPPAAEILVSHALPNVALVAEALKLRAGRKVAITVPLRGERRSVVEHARENAREALGRRLAESTAQRKMLTETAERLGLGRVPDRIEVFDNSHISGTHMVGAMIVSGPDGFMKGAYRKFNLHDAAAPGDDYAGVREVLRRRFMRARDEDPNRDRGQWPDVVLVDGGAGQRSAAVKVLDELGVDDVAVIAIAKGPDRNAGREEFHMAGREPFSLPAQDPVLYFLQRLRDEAHRFAISTHRAKRAKAAVRSVLDEVAGIGATRKRALLRHFGSARAVAAAGLGDLRAVAGVSAALAERIYNHFHPAG
jgi:excinuclease ABC subunit C